MNNNLCDITVVLDRSGSMQALKTELENGFNVWINKQAETPIETRVTLIQFDSEATDVVYENKLITEVKDLKIQPRGGTPLFDAVGRAINLTGDRLNRIQEDNRPGKILFVIITDGEENSSREFTSEVVKSMVEHQTNNYSWEFVFLGVNINAFASGASIGVRARNTKSYSGVRGMSLAFDDLHSVSHNYSLGGKADVPDNDKVGGA